MSVVGGSAGALMIPNQTKGSLAKSRSSFKISSLLYCAEIRLVDVGAHVVSA